MRKMKLDLDELTVEAFETVAEPAGEGTVIGHAPTITACGGSCFISCNGSCPAPCSDRINTECC